MEIGDTVIVRETGRRARIVAERPGGHYQVAFIPEPASDPVDRDTVQSEAEEGIYGADDLAPL